MCAVGAARRTLFFFSRAHGGVFVACALWRLLQTCPLLLRVFVKEGAHHRWGCGLVWRGAAGALG